MPSFEYKIDEKSRIGSRHIARVSDEIRRAFSEEQKVRKVTQQEVAKKLGVGRSRVSRQLMGAENLTARSAAEFLWALGWEAHFEARKPAVRAGDNSRPTITTPKGVDVTAKNSRVQLVMEASAA